MVFTFEVKHKKYFKNISKLNKLNLRNSVNVESNDFLDSDTSDLDQLKSTNENDNAQSNKLKTHNKFNSIYLFITTTCFLLVYLSNYIILSKLILEFFLNEISKAISI